MTALTRALIKVMTALSLTRPDVLLRLEGLAAHISFDRCLGYGLKFPGVFRYTHIQRSASLEQISLLN
jgi:hypothetical protein